MGFIVDILGNLLKYNDRFNKKRTISIPSSVKQINDKAFYANHNIEVVEVSNKVKTIGVRAFFNCINLKKVVIGESVVELKNECFHHCHNLENIEFSKNIASIGDKAFANCRNLKTIDLPNTIKHLGQEAFYSCNSLKSIVLPNNIIHVGDNCFYYCKQLKNVIFPASLDSINKEVFKQCEALTNVEWPDNLKYIGEGAFQSCGFTMLAFPSTLESIGHKSFSDNLNLKKFYINDNINKISYNAFYNCNKVTKFNIGDIEFEVNDLLNIKGASEVEKVYLSNKKCDESIFYKIDFSSRNEMDPIANSIIISTLFSKEELLKRKEIACILPFIAGRCIDSNNYKTIKKELTNNYKEFSRFIKKINGKSTLYDNYSNRVYSYDLYKLAHVMGAFEDNPILRQRACEFLKWLFDSQQIYFFNVHTLLNGLSFNNFNPEIAEFLMNKDNLNEILTAELENNNKGYLSRIVNQFDKIKEYSRSNRGSQSYKKVTLKLVDQYFSSKEFEGVDENNEDISAVLFPYTHQQDTFKQALQIRKKYKNLKLMKKVDDHILHEELSSKIVAIKKQILINSQEVLNDLNQIANSYFSYEYLSKADPRNFVLGKYCSCCAHLEGAGKGIVKASILHPDCQNLVIKDKKGKIVAKSTLYINKKQGYGVFNNIEVSSQVDEKMKEYIYLRYKEAAKQFAQKYNELNPKNPIYQINVGMNLNDLETYIRKQDLQSEKILQGLDFLRYGNYPGDWREEQYVLWKEEKINGKGKKRS